ncbi:MAG: GDSL-type esterase/lipase family protein [Bacteroidales bacterium]|nr:GDSL-type esterase/lipase family protein [Bacteroidales bacterium]MCD8394323.1 GDSL-type esterase/lipase family protein [Bacteroidales bacterium]
MIKKLLLAAAMALPMMLSAAEAPKYNELYYQRASLFELLPVDSTDIVFVGNSLTQICEWHELFNNPKVKNRGIIGDVVQGLRDRIDPVVKGKPAKIFLLSGANDVSHDLSADSIVSLFTDLIEYIQQETPTTRVYVQSVLPINETFNRYKALTGKTAVFPEINAKLQPVVEAHGCTWIDAYSLFVDEEGRLDRQYTNDGLHVLGNGYIKWRDLLLPYVNE